MNPALIWPILKAILSMAGGHVAFTNAAKYLGPFLAKTLGKTAAKGAGKVAATTAGKKLTGALGKAVAGSPWLGKVMPSSTEGILRGIGKAGPFFGSTAAFVGGATATDLLLDKLMGGEQEGGIPTVAGSDMQMTQADWDAIQEYAMRKALTDYTSARRIY